MIFDPFGDFETAGYLRNTLQLKDPVEVKESEHLSFELSMEDALGYLAKKKPIDRNRSMCRPLKSRIANIQRIKPRVIRLSPLRKNTLQ